jgi:hypothetical protein
MTLLPKQEAYHPTVGNDQVATVWEFGKEFVDPCSKRRHGLSSGGCESVKGNESCLGCRIEVIEEEPLDLAEVEFA